MGCPFTVLLVHDQRFMSGMLLMCDAAAADDDNDAVIYLCPSSCAEVWIVPYIPNCRISATFRPPSHAPISGDTPRVSCGHVPLLLNGLAHKRYL